MRFTNISLLFLATLAASRVSADFQITWVNTDKAGLGYFAVPVNWGDRQGIVEALFGGVDQVQGGSGPVPIFWHVEAGLCGFADEMDFYISQAGGEVSWEIFPHNGNGRQIGTCYYNTSTLAKPMGRKVWRTVW